MKRAIRNIFLLAINGFNEVVRHRFFYGMVVVVLLIIGMGMALGSLSMNEQQKFLLILVYLLYRLF